MKYRAEIDGLRTVAVVPVVLFHAGWDVFSGGYVGVDVFFVISGFLITSIIIGERAEGRFSILRFYERRARRILPALFVVLAATLPFAWAWMPPDAFEDFLRSLAFAALFISNVHFWEYSGYFAQAGNAPAAAHLEPRGRGTILRLFPAADGRPWRLQPPQAYRGDRRSGLSVAGAQRMGLAQLPRRKLLLHLLAHVGAFCRLALRLHRLPPRPSGQPDPVTHRHGHDPVVGLRL